MSQSNAVVQSVFSRRIAALSKYVGPKSVVVIEGKSYKASELIAAYRASLDTRAVVSTKRAELEQALRERDGAQAASNAIDEGLKAWVTVQFGLSSQAASEFGFAPRKKRVVSAETKAEAVRKAKATREGSQAAPAGATPPANAAPTTSSS